VKAEKGMDKRKGGGVFKLYGVTECLRVVWRCATGKKHVPYLKRRNPSLRLHHVLNSDPAKNIKRFSFLSHTMRELGVKPQTKISPNRYVPRPLFKLLYLLGIYHGFRVCSDTPESFAFNLQLHGRLLAVNM
jgi:hypothetical protein